MSIKHALLRGILFVVTIAAGTTAAAGQHPIYSARPTLYAWEGKGVSVHFSILGFRPAKHRLTLRENVLFEIDGRRYSGSDGSIPRSEFGGITVLEGRRRIKLPPAIFRDLYNPSVDGAAGRDITRSDGRIEFTISGGDAAGFFEARLVVDTARAKVTRYLSEWPDPDVPKIKTVGLRPR